MSVVLIAMSAIDKQQNMFSLMALTKTIYMLYTSWIASDSEVAAHELGYWEKRAQTSS